MRRKLSLGIVALTAVFVTVAAGASQLTGVSVQTKDSATTLTIQANGSFSHTEYRPADNLLLVDLNGVSPAKLENSTRTLRNQPGVESFRVVGYKNTSGANTTRVEVALAANAAVSVAEQKNAVLVKVIGSAPAAPVASAETAVKAAKPAHVEVAASNGKPVTVRNVTVARAKDGLNVTILASGAFAPKALKLSGPDRLVVDVPNAVPSARTRTINVNSGDVKSIRIARYSVNPPATRIVVDLAAAHDYELNQHGSSAVLAIHSGQAVAAAVPAPKPEATITAKAETAPAPVTAEPVALVEPKVITRPASQTEQAEHAAQTPYQSPSERAAEAASKFSKPVIEIPASNASIRPDAGANMLQGAVPMTTAQVSSGGGCTGNKFTGEPISVNLKDVDLRDFFRLVHEISGLNVVLDPKVAGNLTIVLDDVPWDQALSIVMKNNQLDCQLDGNVLRIATTATLKKEAEDKKAASDAQSLAVDLFTGTRYLNYAVAKDVVPTIKSFLSSRGSVLADDRTNSLIINDIPSTFPTIDRLIKDLDKKTQQVEIEARVVAATRNFARDIGTQLGFGVGGAATTIGGTTDAGVGTINRTGVPGVLQVGEGTGTPPLVPIPFFSNLGVGANTTSGLSFSNIGANYRLDFVLTMAENRGLIKILSRPRIVTQNNIQSVVKQGQRIPIVTAAQLGGPPTVTYVDAYLRLTVRPQITAEGTIFLNVDVENTVPDFSRVTSINPNPVLLTEEATTQVLVTDGGTVVIGGVIQTQSNVAISQVPLLGNIPILGNLFKRRSVSTSTQELIFFLTPKIIQT
jgi:type IV pilus assembly protein PilQ